MSSTRRPCKGVRRATTALALMSAVLVLTSGVAAADTSQATAQAVRLNVLGESIVNSGTVRASNDGVNGEMIDGNNTPGLELLGDQELLAAGALAQDARADDDGTSAACAGAVGPGGVIAIGDDRDCTETIGTTDGVVLDLSDLDLGDNLLDLGNILDGLDLIDLGLDGLLGGGDDLLDLGTLVADAVYAECTADSDGTTTGDATLVNASLGGLLGDDILPSDPGPNLEVDLDLAGAVNLGDLITLTLNEQVTSGGQITVTALRLIVLGAVGDDPLLDLRIGRVTCGANAQAPPIPAIPAEGLPIAAAGFGVAVLGGGAWLVARNRRNAAGPAAG